MLVTQSSKKLIDLCAIVTVKYNAHRDLDLIQTKRANFMVLVREGGVVVIRGAKVDSRDGSPYCNDINDVLVQ